MVIPMAHFRRNPWKRKADGGGGGNEDLFVYVMCPPGAREDSDATAMSLETRSDANQKRGERGSSLSLVLSRAMARCCRALRPKHVLGGRDHDRIFGGRERFD